MRYRRGILLSDLLDSMISGDYKIPVTRSYLVLLKLVSEGMIILQEVMELAVQYEEQSISA